MNDKNVVGDLINFRGLVYSPTNENGVIFLFGRVTEDLNMGEVCFGEVSAREVGEGETGVREISA
jgi:hypothetical protein